MEKKCFHPVSVSHSSWQMLSISVRLSVNCHLHVSPQIVHVKVWALVWPLKDTQRPVLKPLQHCLDCVPQVILKTEPSLSLWLSVLCSMFSLRISLCMVALILRSFLNSFPVQNCCRFTFCLTRPEDIFHHAHRDLSTPFGRLQAGCGFCLASLLTGLPPLQTTNEALLEWPSWPTLVCMII